MSVFDKLTVKPDTAGAQRRCIKAIRDALREYDRATKVDGRRNNGNGRRISKETLAAGVKLVQEGMPIRKAAAQVGVSFSSLWFAKEAAKERGAT